MRRLATLLLLAALSGCGVKWEETSIAQDGFSAAFPQPVTSIVKGNTSEWWARAGETEVKVIVVSLGNGITEALGGAEAVLAARQADLKGAGTERSPMRHTRVGGYPALDYHMDAKFGDGSTRELKGRNVVVRDRVYIVSASWPLGYKSGPESAERIINSFHPL